MAGLSELALKASVQALTERSRQLAYSVILRDQYIDDLETDLNRLCLEFIARQQPVAGHLRFVFATIQINRELERIGDYAESIARQVLAVSALEPQPPYTKFIELGNLAVAMLRDAVWSFLQRDAALAARTMTVEERANTLRDGINAELKELGQAGKLPAVGVVPLMNVARRPRARHRSGQESLRRGALHVHWANSSSTRPGRSSASSSSTWDNACLSQMAEGIGNAMHRPRFQFNSAGWRPLSHGCASREVHGGKGHRHLRQTVSAGTGAAVGPVPGVVALGALAREALPTSPARPSASPGQ